LEVCSVWDIAPLDVPIRAAEKSSFVGLAAPVPAVW